jgi:hypothetical protein
MSSRRPPEKSRWGGLIDYHRPEAKSVQPGFARGVSRVARKTRMFTENANNEKNPRQYLPDVMLKT